MSEKNSEKLVKVAGEFNGEKISFETGKLAPQSDAAVVATVGQTSVLVSVVSRPTDEILDFFPLKVDYEERYYAGGSISGSRFTRREGRPTDDAIVEGRLIDHAIRPLFAKDFMNDTQIIITVLSSDNKNSAGLVGFLGTAAALAVSGLPFSGPIVPLRVLKDSHDSELNIGFGMSSDTAHIDLVASYLDDGAKVQAIESHAHIATESEISEAVKAGAEASKPLFDLIREFASQCDVKPVDYPQAWLNKDAINKIKADSLSKLSDMHSNGVAFESAEWKAGVSEVVKELSEKHSEEYNDYQIKAFLSEVQKEFIRDLVVNQNKRVDGRAMDEVRPLSAEVGMIPRVHGSAIFNRGLTQSLSITTLDSGAQNLLIQTMHGDKEKTYLHHYNFPPFSTGEVGRVGGASRRSIGHGLLAEKAILPVLPETEEFGYAIRVVSEILSSNGSTSMAAACASSLSLMDAGVPIKAHVGGIGVGLFVDESKEDLKLEDYKLLTDIIGQEDFAGYMDYKMTGTREGVTAIQMELKVMGVPVELMDPLLEASKKARMQVLDVMDAAIDKPRAELSEFAPKLMAFKIDKDSIGMVIGSGGVMIKSLMEKFECEIDINEKDEHAIVSVSGMSKEKVEEAKEYILGMVTPVEVGAVYEGVVTRVEPYGAFIEIAPNQIGLLHVSEYAYTFIDDISEHVKLGDKMTVKVKNTDDGKISVSKKMLEEAPEGYVEREQSSDRPRRTGGGGRGGDRNGRSFRGGGNRNHR